MAYTHIFPHNFPIGSLEELVISFYLKTQIRSRGSVKNEIGDLTRFVQMLKWSNCSRLLEFGQAPRSSMDVGNEPRTGVRVSVEREKSGV